MFAINDKVVFSYGRYGIVIGTISDINDFNITVLAKDASKNKTLEYRVHPSQLRKIDK